MIPSHRALGIVGCQVLEDEIAYIAGNDPETRTIVVVDDSKAGTLVSKIKRVAPDKNVIAASEAELAAVVLPAEFSLFIWMKPIGLHQSPPLLREEVLGAVRRLESLTQSILIFYGLCGNAFRNIELMSKGARVPISILSDETGKIVDDCTCTVLGGTDAYRQFLVKEPGVYVLNSMWATHWKQFMQETQMTSDPSNVEEVKMIFEFMDYKKVAKLQTGLGDPEFDERFNEFAEMFGLQKAVRPCTLNLVEDSYHRAKARIVAGDAPPLHQLT